MVISFWIAICFIIPGFIFLAYLQRRIAKANTQVVIWFIFGTTCYGILSMALIVWSFKQV